MLAPKISLLFQIVVIYLAFQSRTYGQDAADCNAVAAAVPTNPADLVPIKPWTMGKGDLALVAEQLLPRDYISDLQKAFGDVNVAVKQADPSKLYITIKAGAEKVGELSLALVPRYRDAVVMNDLRLENPLAAGDPARLKLDQYKAGLPSNVFRFAKDQIFEVARAGGYRSLYSDSQQTFSVFMLYRKLVGMKPADLSAERLSAGLDMVYKFARRELPEPMRAKDTQHFTQMLGNYVGDKSIPREYQMEFRQYTMTKIETPGMKVLKGANGQDMAVLFREGTPNEKLFFIDPVYKVELFTWSSLQWQLRTPLILSLAK